MAVLSVDLAFSRWSDLGIVVLERASARRAPRRSAASGWRPIACEIIVSDERTRAAVDANVLAGRLNHLCGVRDIRIMMLDGPQAWKSNDNGLEHARMSERQLNTPAKTGLPGMVKPVTYRPFAEFCLDVYDALCRRGWRRLETRSSPASPQDGCWWRAIPMRRGSRWGSSRCPRSAGRG